MKITMTNFRCHVNSTFEFPDEGMILLSGDGGAGKSTTFLAIIYALYGKFPAKVKKYTHGKTTCKVVLEYKDMVITRTKPTIVTVTLAGDEDEGDEAHEGDEAQSIIQRRIGMSYDEFVVGAFVHGRTNGTSVISMTPTEQLNFVNILSRESARSAAATKEKIKKQKKELNEDLLKLQGENIALVKQKEEIDLSLAKSVNVADPEEGASPDEIRALLEEALSQLKTTNATISAVSRNIEKERVAQKTRDDIQRKIDHTKIELKQLKSMIIALKPLSQDDLNNLKEEILSYNFTIEHYEAYISYMKDKATLQEAIDAIEEHATQRITELEGIVYDEEGLETLRLEAADAEEYAKKYAQNLETRDAILAKKEEARKTLASIFHKIKTMRLGPKSGGSTQKTDPKTPKDMVIFLRQIIGTKRANHKQALLKVIPRYQCPGCDCQIAFYEDGLVLVDEEDDGESDITEADIIKTNISILEKYITDIEAAAKDFNVPIPELEEEPDDYTSLYKDYFANMNLKEEYDSLLERSLPPAIEKMRAKIAILDEKFKDEGDVEECVEYLKQLKGELQDKITKQEAALVILAEYDSKCSSVKSKETNLDVLTKKLDKLSKSGDLTKLEHNGDLTALEHKLNIETRKVVDINTSISNYRDVLDGLVEYEARQTLLEKCNEMDTKIEEVKTESETVARKLEGSYGLEEAAKEAEILVLEETVNSINEHAKTYTDAFFKNQNPISVRLVCIKNTSVDRGYKMQFNTVIEYEGSVYDSIDELSDSERQRCELAFLFAVNDMTGASILVMDESVNCMNSQMNTDVLNLIHDLCGHKLVLMISHEAIRGVFDAEVPINH